MKHIVLTGGGTAGHVTPNIALIPRLKELGYQISYIGSYNGIEKKLIEEMKIPYYGISSGKLKIRKIKIITQQVLPSLYLVYRQMLHKPHHKNHYFSGQQLLYQP